MPENVINIYDPEKSSEEYSEDIQNALTAVLDKCEQEDQYTRKKHLYDDKMLDLYWHGFQYIYWDSQQQDFRIPTHEQIGNSGGTREEVEFVYNYVTNIFKAHGLSIIATVGMQVPGVVFYPANPENPEDVRAAKKAEALGKIIHKINNSKLHMVHALFILFTQHMVACHQYYERNKEHGEVQVPEFKREMQQLTPDMHVCTSCEFVSDTPVDSCPSCGINEDNSSTMQMVPGIKQSMPVQSGTTTVNKGFPKFEILGTINVRVPSYAADQDACGYLIKYSDQHISYLRNKFSTIRDKISSDDSDSYEKIARAPSNAQYYSESYTNNLVTFKQCWFRNVLFDILDDSTQADLLKKAFPNGAYVAFVGSNIFAEAKDENLDDFWTITKGDLSRTVHSDPLGKSLVQIQDIRNTVSNLLLECLEHSIPTNLADPYMLDFEKYSSQEIKPGLVYPAKKSPIAGSSMGDYFFSFKTSTLPKEGTDLQDIIDRDGEFVSGDLPSVYGGAGEGSKTLGEYQDSATYARGRLSIVNTFLYFWWAQLTHKAIKMYIKEMIEDDQHTMQTNDNRFESLWIYRDDFKGKFKLLIPESAGELPVTYGQKRNIIMQAIQLNSPEINSYLFSPENLKVVLRYFGIEEFTSPEEIQVQRSFRVLGELLQGEPLQPEEDIDDVTIQLRVFKNFLSSDAGMDQRIQNPEGYSNCINYIKMLKQIAILELQQQQAQQMVQSSDEVVQ